MLAVAVAIIAYGSVVGRSLLGTLLLGWCCFRWLPLNRVKDEIQSGHFDPSETCRRLRSVEAWGGHIHSLVFTVLALRDGVIPPTLNYETPDPAIDLDVVAGEPRYGEYKYAINNSFGFGGQNTALIVTAPDR